MGELKITELGPGQLLLGGALTIQNAATIFQYIRDCLTKTDRLVVTIGEDAEADVSFFQILCSAHRTAAEQKKFFKLQAERNPAFEDAAQAAGYIQLKDCDTDRDGGSPWARGEK